MSAQCFKCGALFQAKNEDDVAGDGECERCLEKKKIIALKVDLEMEKRNRANPNRFANTRAEIIQDMIKNPERRINIRELGITPNG